MPRESFFRQVVHVAGDVPTPPPPEQQFAIDSILRLKQHPALLTQGVDTVLSNPTRASFTERTDTSAYLALNVRVLASEVFTPRWFNKRGLVKMTKELSSSTLWEGVLQNMPRSKDENDRVARERIDFKLAGEIISKANARFMTSAITLGLLAAAMGSEVKHIVRPKKIKTFDRKFARIVGDRYGEAAHSYEEFFARVQELIPNPDTTDSQGENTLFGVLSKNDTFVFDGARCPAKPLTLLILQEWGRKLDRDTVYKERFKQAVTK